MKLFSLDTPLNQFEDYLRKNRLIDSSDQVMAIEIPGEGNMNVVIRTKTNNTSLILKQSREFVQKYPQIPAPLDRILVENFFYTALSKSSVAYRFPKVLHFDEKNFLIVFQDLGAIQDMTHLYARRNIDPMAIKDLVQVLSEIHAVAPDPKQPKNTKLRELNHQHIFVLPFMQDNGFDLDDVQPGLQNLSEPFKANAPLKKKVEEIGQRYLENGTTLIHGDYYPGSWMKAQNQIYVLDPEFSFVGFAEFDLGVMAAHLILATNQPSILDAIFNEYVGDASKELSKQIAGIEMIRRLIGLAQLPLQRTLYEKEQLLQLAHKFVLS